MTTQSDNTFHLGLTMAGAISAGAYTAGVLDVLLEALDLHNARYARRRAAEEKGEELDEELAACPRHKVLLRVMSGTSAGGVSTGLAVAGLIGARKAQEGADGTQIEIAGKGDYTSSNGYSYSYRYILEPLHYVWVQALELGDGSGRGFLTTDDLEGGAVRSALNSQHIDNAADTALTDISWNGGTYRFLARDLELFLTTTNLQGMPYQISFAGSQDPRDAHSHAMSQHSAVRHFRIGGLGNPEEAHTSDWLDAWTDEGIPLTVTPGRIDFQDESSTWRDFKDAAVATGAFPVGLAAREIRAQAQDFGPVALGEKMRGGALPINLRPMVMKPDGTVDDNRPVPQMGKVVGADEPTNYVAVDGGVANNEPFELARYTLRRKRPEGEDAGGKFLDANPRTAHEAHSAVLMIDPFPEGPVFTPLTVEQTQKLSALVPVARTLVPALINQARFKPGELIEASSKAVHSRYLLAPSRREGSTERDAREAAGGARPARTGYQGAAAIACGSFGGFGGFFDRAFRAHDYMLGQRNCHSFLARHFRLDRGNPVLGLGGDGEATGEFVRVLDPGPTFFEEVARADGGVDVARRPLPEWPRLGQEQLDPVLAAARTRIAMVGATLVRLSELPWHLSFVLGMVWKIRFLGLEGLGPKVSKALKSIVISELIGRDQHQDFREKAPGVPYERWQRRVLVALAQAGEDPVPVMLDPSDRAAATAKGDKPRDLLTAAVEPGDPVDERGERLAELRAFLDDPAMEPHLWRAPDVAGGPPSYTLAVMRPEISRLKHYIRSIRSRIGGLFGK